MLSRITVPLVAAAILVFACGPRTPNPVASVRPKTGADRGVTSHVMVDTAQGTVRFAIEVSFREYEEAARLLPAAGGSKKSWESEESRAEAPFGVLDMALLPRCLPTLSPTNGLAPWRRVNLEVQVRYWKETLNRLTTH